MFVAVYRYALWYEMLLNNIIYNMYKINFNI